MTDVAVRELWRGRVWRIFPLRLVERRADGSALLWSPPGSDVRRPFADGVELRIPGDLDWTLESWPSRWEEVAVVVPGSRHTLWHFFEQNGSLRNWYVNFERESRWNGACFDLVDEKLDLVVAPDGAVTWKDEDELEAAPHVDTAELRALAEAVLADPPWPSGFEHFRADPAWPKPECRRRGTSRRSRPSGCGSRRSRARSLRPMRRSSGRRQRRLSPTPTSGGAPTASAAGRSTTSGASPARSSCGGRPSPRRSRSGGRSLPTAAAAA